MSECPNCETAATQLWHQFTAGCMGCAARAASRSPPYRKARESGVQDRAYRNLLAFYGLTHQDVKDAAAKDFESTASIARKDAQVT